MTTQHIPAPWFIDIESIYDENANVIVRRIESNSYSAAQNLANARLIAAAPELLEALERSLKGMIELTGSEFVAGFGLSVAIKQASDAIARARGQQ